ncbi:MAG: HAD family phosphatase [Clostridia bacterium]|nr:HAD family phosphatase [Clostridia bacterium]
MAKYSLIALDMDGTLLNSELKLSEGNKEAVHRAAAAGKHVVLSTGRCLAEIRDTLRELPEIRYLVCENGSCVYDCKYDHTIHVAPVPVEEILYILNLVKNERTVLQCFHENQPYFNQPNGEWSYGFRVGNYRDVFDKTAVWDAKLFDTYAEKPFRIEKINLYFENARARDRIHEILEKRNLKLANSIGYMIEVVAGEADKGAGLIELCKHLNIPIGETIAVGDSPNDLEILRTAGLSAAMGNAWPEAKAAADIVTEDCDHDGVAKVIYDYLLAE